MALATLILVINAKADLRGEAIGQESNCFSKEIRTILSRGSRTPAPTPPPHPAELRVKTGILYGPHSILEGDDSVNYPQLNNDLFVRNR